MDVSRREVREYLVEIASTGKIIYYAELYNHFKIRTGPSNDANPIPMHLGVIMREDADRNNPLLPSIVVNKKGETPRENLLPNDKYFETLAEIRKVDIPTSGPLKSKIQRQYFLPERDAVFARYATTGMVIDPE